MKHLLTIAAAMLALSTGAQGQWVQTQGPEGGNASAIAHTGDGTIAVMRPDALYRLADGAHRWTRIGTLYADAFHVAGDAVLATTTGRVLRSSDGGHTWAPVGPNGQTIVRSVDGTTAYATGEGLYRSKDDGATWTSIDGNIRNIINGQYTPTSIAGLGDTLVAGEPFTDGILRSTDGGVTWDIVTAGLPDSTNPSEIAQFGGVFYAQMNNEVAGTIVGVYRSNDGGLTWSAINDGLPERGANRGFIFSFFDEGGAVTASTMMGLYRLEDTTWVGVASGIVVGTTVDGAGNLLRATFDGVGRSDDGGQTWGRVDGGLLHLHISGMTSVGNRVIASASSGIHYSDDRGSSWQRTGIDRIEEFESVGGVIVGRGSEYSNVGLVRSTDSGASWMPANAGIERPAGGAASLAAGDGVLFVAYHDRVYAPIDSRMRRGGLYRSTDAGASWTLLRGGLPLRDDSTLAALFVAATGDTALVQTFHGFFRTTDRGETWTAAGEGLAPNESLRSMTAHGGRFYAAVGTHVLVSSDGGASFSESGRPGLGLGAPVMSLSSAGDALIAITSDRVTTKLHMLANDEWQVFRVMPDNVEGISMALAGGRLYVGTEANSVMRLDFEASGVDDDASSAAITWAPHPLSGTVSSVSFIIDRAADVSLELFDASGRRVAGHDTERFEAGHHRITVPIAGLASGAYGYRLSVGEKSHGGVVVVAE